MLKINKIYKKYWFVQCSLDFKFSTYPEHVTSKFDQKTFQNKPQINSKSTKKISPKRHCIKTSQKKYQKKKNKNSSENNIQKSSKFKKMLFQRRLGAKTSVRDPQNSLKTPPRPPKTPSRPPKTPPRLSKTPPRHPKTTPGARQNHQAHASRNTTE